MTDDHFYLTLPSGGANSRYVVNLPERIRLNDDYEMSISEIIYPHTWYNVDNDDKKYWIGVNDNKVFVKSGFYRDGEVFASNLTHQVTRAFAGIPTVDVKFVFVKHLDRIRMQISNTLENTVIISADLMEFLGFGRKMITQQLIDRVGSTTFDINRSLNLMYVYCDVASHSIVGDTKTPLMRVFNAVGKHGDVVRLAYVRPQYVPVGRREFDSVTISINNELGEPLKVRSGQFVTKLHFRRRR